MWPQAPRFRDTGEFRESFERGLRQSYDTAAQLIGSGQFEPVYFEHGPLLSKKRDKHIRRLFWRLRRRRDVPRLPA